LLPSQGVAKSAWRSGIVQTRIEMIGQDAMASMGIASLHPSYRRRPFVGLVEGIEPGLKPLG
jgi:hypothetical protein